MKKVYVLRTCDAALRSHGGFQWPESGAVSCPDWDPTPSCGNGLHGLLWGVGNARLLDWSADAKWLVVEVDASKVVDIDGSKVKFPRGIVVFCGNRTDAVARIIEFGADAASVVGGTATAGDGGTATAGYMGTATAGEYGTATAGEYGTATAGDGGTATAGYRGTLIIKHWQKGRYRAAVGEVGIDGIKARTPYFVRNGVLTERIAGE